MGGPLDSVIHFAGEVAPWVGDDVREAGQIGHDAVNAGGTILASNARAAGAFSRIVHETAVAVTPAASAVNPDLGAVTRTVADGSADVANFTDRARNAILSTTNTAADVVQAGGDVGGAVVDASGTVALAVSDKGSVTVARNVGHETAVQARKIIGGWENHPSPGGFINWLAGPKAPSGADLTGAIPGLQKAIGDAIDGSMKDPMVAKTVGRVLGFEYVPDGDYYTTNKSSLQSLLGYDDFYDKTGKLMGMDLDNKVMTFNADGINYRVELWKGSYANGGAFGGEIGIYTRGADDRGPMGNWLEQHIPGYYSAANGGHQVKMTQEIYNQRTGEVYFRNDGKGSNDGKHYWNLAIRTAPGVRPEDLGQRGTIVMPDKQSARALCAAMNAKGGRLPAHVGAHGRSKAKGGGLSAHVGADGRSVDFTWSPPHRHG